MTIVSFLIGLIMIAAGLSLTVKTEWFMNNFGRIAWFEEKLSSEGGSRLGYKLVGFAFLLLGIITLTGNINNFMAWILSPFLRYR